MADFKRIIQRTTNSERVETGVADLQPNEICIVEDGEELIYKDRNGKIISVSKDKYKVNIIEDLKNSTKYKIGDVIEVLGYYTPGDGGGHSRQKVAEGYIGEDKIIGYDGSIWKIMFSGKIHVSWLGAKGDGITDDTLAIQKSIRFENVIFDKKTYLVDNLSINTDVNFLGKDSIFKSKLFQDGNTKNILESEAIDSNIIFKNITFDGACDLKGSINLDNMIRIKKADTVTFDNCGFTRYGALDKAEDVYLYNRLGVMAQIFNCKKVNIINCNFYNNRGNEQIQVMTDGTVDCILTVYGNRIFENSEAYAWLLPMNLKKGIVVNNYLNGNRRTFINLMSSNIFIANNYIANTSSRGIASESGGLTRTENITISNNYIENCAEGAININGGNLIITGNKAINCSNYACRIGGIIIDSKWLTLNPLAPTETKILKNIKIYDNDFSETNGQIRVLNETKETEKSYCENIIIGDNKLKNSGFLFYLNNCRKVKIKDNDIKNYGVNASVIPFRLEDDNYDIDFLGNTLEGYMYRILQLVGTDARTLENLFIKDNNFKSSPSGLITGNSGATIKNITLENNNGYFTYSTDSDYNSYLNVVKFYNGNIQEQSFAKFGIIKTSNGTLIPVTKNCTSSNRDLSNIIVNSLNVGFGEFNCNFIENIKIGDTFTFNTGFIGTVIYIENNKFYTSPSPSAAIENSIITFVDSSILNIALLNDPYYIMEMQNRGIYQEYHTYRNDLNKYEKSQNIVEGVMNLNVFEKPQIPESIVEFAKEYNIILEV